MMAAVVLFTRSLRLQDNTALNAAIADGVQRIYPLFIFTEEQANPAKNEYFSPAAFRYMVETLAELSKEIQAQGGTFFIVRSSSDLPTALFNFAEEIRRNTSSLAIYENIDITPYARQRSADIAATAARRGIAYKPYEDVDLIGMNEGLLADGRMYSVFTPYYRNFIARYTPAAAAKTLRVPAGHWGRRLPRGTTTLIGPKELTVMIRELGIAASPVLRGGRSAAEARLADFLKKNHAEYKARRDFMNLEATSRLGAAIRFGVLSPREVAAATRDNNSAWLQELIWRSFYYHYAYHHPEVLTKGAGQRTATEKMHTKRDENAAEWRAFVAGRTGIPLVDAGVRELAALNWCHNRVRMVLSTYVSRGIHYHWSVGEKWMARQLIDHDRVSNAAGWAWGAGLAPSAPPYFRVMSPWSQAKRFDPEAIYIKRWIPELAEVPAKDILNWSDAKIREKWRGKVDYPVELIPADWAAAVRS